MTRTHARRDVVDEIEESRTLVSGGVEVVSRIHRRHERTVRAAWLAVFDRDAAAGLVDREEAVTCAQLGAQLDALDAEGEGA